MSSTEETIYVECDCTSFQHTLRFTYIPESSYQLNGETYKIPAKVYMHAVLRKRPFWHRFRVAFRYLFGLNTEYDYEETIIGKEQAEKLVQLLSHLK